MNKSGRKDGKPLKGSTAACMKPAYHQYFILTPFFIDKNSPYVTPVPGEDLGSFRSFTLARPVREGDTEIVVNEPTNDISVTTGFFVRNSLSLRIGNEIIEFKGVSADPPYKFTGCRRGACNTVNYPHEKGEEVHHLREMFGRFVPDPESALFDSIAARTAKIVSDCNSTAFTSMPLMEVIFLEGRRISGITAPSSFLKLQGVSENLLAWK
jgi:hypothetical protein